MIDVYKQLNKQDAILSALNGKKLSGEDWVKEIIQQVYSLNLVCLQQQEEIDQLRKELGK